MSSTVCIVFSGKRKSGKDYIVSRFVDMLKLDNLIYSIACISKPIKSYFANDRNLDFELLISSDIYKESYRKQMVDWMEHEIQIHQDPYLFVRQVVDQSLAQYLPDVMILSDARRLTDLEFCLNRFGSSNCILARVEAEIDVRIERGWVFTDGIDNYQTECGLDDYTDWDFILTNNGIRTDCDVEFNLKNILFQIKRILNK